MAQVLPRLMFSVNSLENMERLGVVKVLASIFAEKGSDSLVTTNPLLFHAFLGRFNDICLEVRIICVNHSIHILLNQQEPEVRNKLVESLCQRQHDKDKLVRRNLVKTIVGLMQSKEGLELLEEHKQLINCLKERCRDVVWYIRKEALKGLAEIYKQAVKENSTAAGKVWIPETILQGYYVKQRSDISLVGKLLNSSLVPGDLGTKQKMRQLLGLVCTQEETSYKALVELLKHSQMYELA